MTVTDEIKANCLEALPRWLRSGERLLPLRLALVAANVYSLNTLNKRDLFITWFDFNLHLKTLQTVAPPPPCLCTVARLHQQT